MKGSQHEASTRLARRLGLTDAVVIGLGSMIGAGVFAAHRTGREGGRHPGCSSGLASPPSSRTATRRPRPQLAAHLSRLRRHVRLRPRAARALLGLPRRLGLRGRQDRELRGDGADRSAPTPHPRSAGRSPSVPSSRSPPSTTSGFSKTALADPGARRCWCSPRSRSSSSARCLGGRPRPATSAPSTAAALHGVLAVRRACCSSRSPATPGSPPSVRRSPTRPHHPARDPHRARHHPRRLRARRGQRARRRRTDRARRIRRARSRPPSGRGRSTSSPPPCESAAPSPPWVSCCRSSPA